MNWWVLRALFVLEFVIVGLLFMCFLARSVGEHDVMSVVCLTFLALMACTGLIIALLLEILEKIAVQGKKRRG